VTPGKPILVRQNRAPARPAEVVDMRSDRKVRVRYTDERGGTDVVLVERCSEPRSPWLRFGEPIARTTAGRAAVHEAIMQGLDSGGLTAEQGRDMLLGMAATQPAAPALRAVPKPPKPMRDEAYLAWVRNRRCCVCHKGATEAHHHTLDHRGMGQKVHDYLAIPLCTRCHRQLHDTATVGAYDVTETDDVLLRAQRACLSAWCEERGIDINHLFVTALIEAIRREKEER
jgi:hypothetical protein